MYSRSNYWENSNNSKPLFISRIIEAYPLFLFSYGITLDILEKRRTKIFNILSVILDGRYDRDVSKRTPRIIFC